MQIRDSKIQKSTRNGEDKNNIKKLRIQQNKTSLNKKHGRHIVMSIKSRSHETMKLNAR